MNRVNSIDVRAKETVLKPNMKWENGTYSMNSVLRKFKLPRVVQCTSVQANDVTREKSNFDFLQPMLLYSRHNCQKVTANSLNIDSQTGQTTEIGDPLLVPEDYKGWFAVLNTRTKNKAVPHYRNVGQLAQSDCDTFLIGGTDCVQAVQRLKKDCPPAPRILYPGDVLRMGNIYLASTKVKTGRFSKPQKKEEKFLLCTDQNDREVLMPIDSTGMFYIVRNKTKQTPVPVMQMRDIIPNTKFPCEVKLIFGRLPTTPCFFTGMLVLKNAFPETSAVASSIVNLRNILLEIPTDIPMMFRVAVSDKALLENKGYKDAVRLCQEKADTYMRNIKVSQGQVGDDEDVQHQREEVSVPSYSPHQQRDNPIVPSIPEKHIPRITANNDPRSSKATGSAGFGHSVLPIPPKSNTPNKYPVPTTDSPPLPPRVRVKSRSESTESNSPPRPPPQGSKPSHLERVISQRAPPPMVRLDQHQSGNRNSKVPARASQYEEVWLENKPELKSPPKPPPTCFPSSLRPRDNLQLWRQRSVTISVNDGYLTVPVFLSQSQEDSSSNPDEGMSLADKLNFWKQLDKTNQAASCDVSQGTGIARTGSVVYSECGISKDKSKTGNQSETRQQGPAAPEGVDGKIYENIEDLRQVRVAKKSQIVFDNPESGDTMYESVDDVVYEPIDALPVGASANRASYADSGIMDDGTEDETADISPAVAEMSVIQIFESLKEIGVSKKTREYFRKEKVDGRLLTTFNEESLKSNFPSISNIEIKKIGMLIRGLELRFG